MLQQHDATGCNKRGAHEHVVRLGRTVGLWTLSPSASVVFSSTLAGQAEGCDKAAAVTNVEPTNGLRPGGRGEADRHRRGESSDFAWRESPASATLGANSVSRSLGPQCRTCRHPRAKPCNPRVAVVGKHGGNVPGTLIETNSSMSRSSLRFVCKLHERSGSSSSPSGSKKLWTSASTESQAVNVECVEPLGRCRIRPSKNRYGRCDNRRIAISRRDVGQQNAIPTPLGPQVSRFTPHPRIFARYQQQ